MVEAPRAAPQPPAYTLSPATPFLVPLPMTASEDPPWLQEQQPAQVTVIPKTSAVVQNELPEPPHQLPPPDVIKELPRISADRLESARVLVLVLVAALFQFGIAILVWNIINSRSNRKRQYAEVG